MPDFELSRSATVDAPPAVVHPLLDDFHAWRAWSPWEDVDPDLERRYAGPDSGVGARYEWEGNRRAGKGSMEVVESTPSRVVVDLRFLKPFKADNTIAFDLNERDGRTHVTWTMTGRRNVVAQAMGALFLDRAIGRDFEKGLARLRAEAEPGPA